MNTNERCDSKYKKVVVQHCYDALSDAGFTRFRKDGVDWPFGNGFNCWVGLNEAINPEYIEINPFVGIHAVPIMKLYTSLEGRKYSRSIATYAVHLGELVPEERVFRFARSTDIAAEAVRLAQLYVRIGLPYAESLADYQHLLPCLQGRVSMLGGYPERVASCLYLMGRKDEARAFVSEFMQERPEYFKNFAVEFSRLATH